jgi:hypothetical protein
MHVMACAYAYYQQHLDAAPGFEQTDYQRHRTHRHTHAPTTADTRCCRSTHLWHFLIRSLVSVVHNSAGYFVRVRGGGEAGDRDAKVSRALGPIFSEAYLRSLQKRSCRLQPKFFGELAQVNSQLVPAAASAALHHDL